MAQKFGGKFSPTGTPATPDTARPEFQGQRRSRAGGRVNMLFIMPLFFAVQAFRSGPTGLALYLAAFAVMMLAAWLTRDGIKAQEAYDARKIARRPAIPRKMFGSVLTGAGLFTAGLAGGGGLVNAIIFGVVGTALHFAAFGPDPLADKGAEGIDQFQSDRVAKAVDEAERHLTAMKDAILRAQDRQLEARVDRFATTARTLFRTIEGDPRDLTAARKDIGVFLMGARDATAKFADLYAQTRNTQARADYEQLLTDLEQHFKNRTDALLSNDRTDLDVEISVLRDRLQFEGPRPQASTVAEPISSTPQKGD